jgi:predicted RNase H-like HicB family nuclease
LFLEREDDGTGVAHRPALKGCHSSGDIHEEAMENVKEAILKKAV